MEVKTADIKIFNTLVFKFLHIHSVMSLLWVRLAIHLAVKLDIPVGMDTPARWEKTSIVEVPKGSA